MPLCCKLRGTLRLSSIICKNAIFTNGLPFEVKRYPPCRYTVGLLNVGVFKIMLSLLKLRTSDIIRIFSRNGTMIQCSADSRESSGPLDAK